MLKSPDSSISQRCVALLGRKDEPTDAVEEYCHHLSAALLPLGISLELQRVPWLELGWPAALQKFDKDFPDVRDVWFFVQYTALSWSRRGFSLHLLKLLDLLKKKGARCAVVFHDAEAYSGSRIVDRIRRLAQLHAMKQLLKRSGLAVFTIPYQIIPWVPPGVRDVFVAPVGANLPAPESAWFKKKLPAQWPTVGIFSLSEGAVGEKEVQLAAEAMRYASEQLGPLRLTILGRNSGVGGQRLKELLADTQVRVDVLGLLKSEEVVQVLGACDAMLFVRGPISTRRGSAIAGIACGLPVIGRAGWETGPPLTEAGVALLPDEDRGQYGPTLLKVLSDPAYRAELAERSRNAQERHFSWKAIAEQYSEALSKHSENAPE